NDLLTPWRGAGVGTRIGRGDSGYGGREGGDIAGDFAQRTARAQRPRSRASGRLGGPFQGRAGEPGSVAAPVQCAAGACPIASRRGCDPTLGQGRGPGWPCRVGGAPWGGGSPTATALAAWGGKKCRAPRSARRGLGERNTRPQRSRVRPGKKWRESAGRGD